MKTFATDENNDLYIDARGNLAILTGINACALCSESAIGVLRNEMPYQYDEGMPLMETAFLVYKPAAFEAAARNQLLKVDHVTGVSKFFAEVIENNLSYTATIATDFGETVING